MEKIDITRKVLTVEQQNKKTMQKTGKSIGKAEAGGKVGKQDADKQVGKADAGQVADEMESQKNMSRNFQSLWLGLTPIVSQSFFLAEVKRKNTANITTKISTTLKSMTDFCVLFELANSSNSSNSAMP